KQQLINYSSNLEIMVDEKTQAVVELKNAVLETMAELVEERDQTTGSHIDRTMRYLAALLDAMQERGIYEKELAGYDRELILRSSQLHDVGKISVRDSILLKPERLTNEEFEEIKNHTVFGEQVIDRIKTKTADSDFLEYARIFAATHHERWDGGGYPKGLVGEEIPILGRIMAIADVYDALVSERPYKKAFSHEQTVKIIQEGRGIHFDPILTDVFIDINEIFEGISRA
ncbi:MAG: HD-GYP domain-containing protein, partial [Defluviitaleaceae bacterium]|nr:HD-GYP domain-containing protein [Defluviitaleaceae bacterium]